MANTWLSPPEWFASLPSSYLAAALVITDPAGRLLVVKPNYRPGWSLPGGIVEDGEAPHLAASREVAEELGLRLPAGDLLVVAWSAAHGDRPRAITSFLFDGGTFTGGPGDLRIQESELDAAEFVSWEEAETRLPAAISLRVPAARQARARGRTVYLPYQMPG